MSHLDVVEECTVQERCHSVLFQPKRLSVVCDAIVCEAARDRRRHAVHIHCESLSLSVPFRDGNQLSYQISDPCGNFMRRSKGRGCHDE